MAVTASPLSYLWTKKEICDYLRSQVSEHDDQILTDDNILAALQSTIMELHRLIPAIRDEYTIEIPFCVSTIASPLVSTTPAASANNTKPLSIIHAPAANTVIAATSGIYNFHYEMPTNFEVLGWKDVWNSYRGSCRRTSDYSQLMGICLGNNTQLSRVIAWYNHGRNLDLVVRENVPTGTIVYGKAVRTVIPLILLAPTTVPSGIAADVTATALNETFRHAPAEDIWAKIDCPDDYMGLASKMTLIKLWGIVGKTPTESTQASVDRELASLTQNMELGERQKENYIRDTQWKDRGHL